MRCRCVFSVTVGITSPGSGDADVLRPDCSSAGRGDAEMSDLKGDDSKKEADEVEESILIKILLGLQSHHPKCADAQDEISFYRGELKMKKER